MGHDHVHSRRAHEFADDPLHLLRELRGRLADRDHVIDQRRRDLPVGAHRHFGIELRVAQHVDLESVARPYDVLAGSRGKGRRRRGSRRGRRADRGPIGWRLDSAGTGDLRHGAVAGAPEARQNQRQDEQTGPPCHRAVTMQASLHGPYAGLTAQTNSPILIRKIRSCPSSSFPDLVEWTNRGIVGRLGEECPFTVPL